MGTNEKKCILTVDDSPVICKLIERLFGENYLVKKAFSGESALAYLSSHFVDLILLDIDMPKMDGYEVMEQLKINAKTAGIPVIFLTGLDSHDDELKALKMGAVDYIMKPFHPEILMTKVEQAIVRNESEKSLYQLVQTKIAEAEKFRQMAYLDPLTAMWNRLFFENQVNLYLQGERPEGFFFILDIDNFKQINDEYGHMAGDNVLIQLAEILQNAETQNVLTARLAGDEFVIFLKGVSTDNYAEILAESIMMEISAINIENKTDLSVSVGIARVDRETKTFLDIYGKADRALYQAKRTGKGDFFFFGQKVLKEA